MTPDLSVYLVTDTDTCLRAGRTVVETVAAAVAGGATAVQLREKDCSPRAFLQLVTAVSAVLPEHVALFVNDRVDVYAAARARGVRVTGIHVGQSDLPVSTVRAIAGPEAVIGLSASTPSQLAAAAADPAGVAYVGIGALHPTATKKDAPDPLGIERFAELCALSHLPAVAIGGVTAADLPRLRTAGAAGAAVVSAVCAASDPQEAAAELAAAWAGADRAPRSGGARADRTPFSPRPPRVLAIAGTDPTGGAGIQADLKSIAANGGYGMAVVTALVAQNTRGVRSVHVPPASFLREQLDAVSDDVTIDAVKIGMLATAEIAGVVDEWLGRVRPPLTVLDPVMVATSGDRLLEQDAVDAVRRLARRVDLITPNIPELAILAGAPIARDWPEALAQAERVSRELGVRVLAKGGHLRDADAPDALVDAVSAEPGRPAVREFRTARVMTANTHGTGCSLSSALSTRLAGAVDWEQPIADAKAWLTESLAAADGLEVGGGAGPIHHLAGLWGRAVPGSAATPPLPTPPALPESWWSGIADVRDRIHSSPFVRGLIDGRLERSAYRWYLGQDALYLAGYADLLDRASASAPTADEATFWADAARACREEELRLHRDELGDEVHALSPVTAAYLGQLRAAASHAEHAVLIAAVLPCFWIYADVGAGRTPTTSDHPYREWLAAYAAEAFHESTRRAIGYVTSAWNAADATTRSRAWDAFRASAELEDAFFRAPLERAR